jgi:AraC family transcriptional regulator of arabinose operon
MMADMLEEHVENAGEIGCLGMTLIRIWRVDRDGSYQVYPRRERETNLVAIRTVSGAGVVEVEEAGRFELMADTLLVTELARLRHYGTLGEQWRFDWFEFVRAGGMEVPWHTQLTVERLPAEAAAVTQIVARLAMPDRGHRAAASAAFAALLYDWAARGQPEGQAGDPTRALVARAVAYLQQDLAHPASITALAAQCGVSARWLRQAFARVLATSPKRYATDLRLRRAAQALSMGLGNVSQLADQFGYASPFHFSRAFKAYFGCSPSVYERAGGALSGE